MAYGKQPLETVPGSVSQMAGDASRRRNRIPSGGSNLNWREMFKPSTVAPDLGRLIPGEFITQRIDDNGNVYSVKTPWKETMEHYHGGLKRSGVCSAGPFVLAGRDKRDPCLGCDIFWEDYEERKATGTLKARRNRISLTNRYVFYWLNMGTFHYGPLFNNNGQPLVFRNGQPILGWTKCTGVGCRGCQTAQKTQQGHIQPWPMSKTHFQVLTEGYAYAIGSCCTTCLGRGTVNTVSWNCAGCGTAIFDLATTTANQEQIKTIVNKPYSCPACGVTAYPKEQLNCSGCATKGTVPQRATIFDVDMQLMAVKGGEGDQTTLVVQATSDPKPLDPQFTSLLSDLPDINAMFAPTSLEEQARIWHRHAANQQPQQAATALPVAMPYSQPMAPVVTPQTTAAPIPPQGFGGFVR